MKNFSKILLGLTGALAMTACSSTEEAPVAPAGDVTISVVTTDALQNRAIETVEGYKLTAVMQLLDKDGKTVTTDAGNQATQDASAGTCQFTIKHTDIEKGATNAIFWAEYVPTGSAAKVYDSSDLTKVAYNTTAFDLTDKNLMKAADAFAGKLSSIEASNTVTLARPVAQVTFMPTNPDMVAGATKLEVKYDAISAYNVATSNAATDASGYQAVTLTNASFAPAAEPWFTTFMIMPGNYAKYGKAITMTVTMPTGSRDFTIKADEIPCNPNWIINVSAELSEQQDYVVDVTINGDYVNEPEPEKPAEFKMGAYVKADGTATNNKDEAVGIVFAVGAIGDDEIAKYPAAFAGKTIKGYVVSLNGISTKREVFNADKIVDGLPVNNNAVNGTEYTDGLLTALNNSAFVNAYNTFVEGHKLSGANVSGWYVPAQIQVQTWYAQIMPTTDPAGKFVEGSPFGDDAFKALFPMDTMFDRTITTDQSCMYATCTTNQNGNIQGGSLAWTVATSTATAKFSQIDVKTKNQSVLCRPMFTVFE